MPVYKSRRADSLIASLVFLLVGYTGALADCPDPVAHVVSLQGDVEVDPGTGAWRPLILEAPLCAGDTLRVGPRSRAELALRGSPKLRVDQNSILVLKAREDRSHWLALLRGAALFFSRRPQSLQVDTPFINGAVEGTEFLVEAASDRGAISVLEGRVRVDNERGDDVVGAGEQAVAKAGEAPEVRLIVRPKDAVQWALFYPPVLLPQSDATSPAAQQRATAALRRRDFPQAFAAFDAVPEALRGTSFHLQRAAALLSVGRLDQAQQDLDRAVALDPASGTAHALRATVAVAGNDGPTALEAARRAVDLEPNVAATWIALSYAEQARFDLAAAAAALQSAIEAEPHNALAQARLAEIKLMLGDNRAAGRTAERASDLDPDLERTQTMLGFVRLINVDLKAARQAFGRAIEADSSAPLPRLGLGLAQIRGGDLRGGREQIEIAVALNPEDALMRSYLGKAYFDEKREEIDAQQFDVAKRLDPLDPTPWLYDAIRKQTENQPVAALRDLERSIALNDNRAVYRSRQLLDQDRAARGASLARIYNDLGFEELGRNEATKSLAIDAGNSAAHRLLADLFAVQPGREAARASELLQAQLLQDVNVDPVQPSMAETTRNVVVRGGPARPGFNEYTPLFERNQAQLNLSGVVGTERTRGSEAVVSGVYDQVSLSAGQYHYQSDGFRENADVRHTISNAFAQVAVSPELNVQAEYRRRRSELGDIQLRYSPSSFSNSLHRDIDQDTLRSGLRFSPTPGAHTLASFIYTELSEKSQEGPADGFSDVRAESTGYQGELQQILEFSRGNLVFGGGSYSIDQNRNGRFIIPGLEFPLLSQEGSTNEYFGYAHLTYMPLDALVGTIGFSYADYHQLRVDASEFNPKLGVQWQLTPDVRLRGAAFRTLKPSMVVNQTLQPTQVAGFNQLFDDQNATKSWVYAVGIDYRVLQDVYIGGELSRRDMQVYDFSTGQARSWNEDVYSSYIYWTPLDELAIALTPQFASLESNEAFLFSQVDTLSAPVTATWFHPSGAFGGTAVTYVHQRVERPADAALGQGSNNFVLVDATLGFRLPRRLGVIAVEGRNLLDEKFKYQDNAFRTFTAQSVVSPFIPERAVLARLSLSF